MGQGAKAALAAAALLLAALPARPADVTGYAEGKGFVFASRHRESDPWTEGWATLFAKVEERAGDATLTGSLRLEDLSSGPGQAGFDPADRKARRSPASVRDFWLRVPLAGRLDLQAGRFELGWGKTDGYSPADAFLPRDLTDLFADEKLPLWGVRLTGQWGNVRAEGVAVPVTTPWRLPELGSRYAPLAPAGTEIRDGEEAPPKPGFGALRLLASFGEWDAGLWGRFGVRPSPILEISPDPASSDPLRPVLLARRRYVREEGAGVEVSRLLGPWIVRGEAAALFTRDDVVGDALLWAAAAERSWGDTTLLVTLADNAGDRGKDEAVLFDRAMLPVLIAAVNQTFPWGSGKIVWSAGLAHGDGLLEAEAGYDLTDFWRVTGGAEIPYGSTDGPMGALHDARRARLALRYAW
jgi:hypothetical protein